MSTEVCKFQTLKPDQTYEVKSYTEPIRGKFGDYRILLVSKMGSKESFELFSTQLLINYIDKIETDKLVKKFNFIVKERNGKKFPFLEGYSIERKWIVLE